MYYGDIEDDAITNKYYRNVLATSNDIQLVLMSLKPGEYIPAEIHYYSTQVIIGVSGSGIVTIGNIDRVLEKGKCIMIPSGAIHTVKNISDRHDLKLYTFYAPPEHGKYTKQKRMRK